MNARVTDTDLDDAAVAFALRQVAHWGISDTDLRCAIAAYLNAAADSVSRDSETLRRIKLAATPGPWVSEDTGSRPGAFSVVGDGNQLAALVYGETRQTQKANARLISAAPDMLAALIEFVAESDRVTVAFKMAQAAIAKATGKSDAPGTAMEKN